MQTLCGVALDPPYPLHQKSLSRTALLGGEPAKQRIAVRELRGCARAEGFYVGGGLFQGFILGLMWLKCLSLGAVNAARQTRALPMLS